MFPRGVLEEKENPHHYRICKYSEIFLSPIRILQAMKNVHSYSCNVLLLLCNFNERIFLENFREKY